MFIMASARFTASLMLTHRRFTGKTLFELDADIFGQNHHIGAGDVFRRQFILNTDGALV